MGGPGDNRVKFLALSPACESAFLYLFFVLFAGLAGLGVFVV